MKSLLQTSHFQFLPSIYNRSIKEKKTKFYLHCIFSFKIIFEMSSLFGYCFPFAFECINFTYCLFILSLQFSAPLTSFYCQRYCGSNYTIKVSIIKVWSKKRKLIFSKEIFSFIKLTKHSEDNGDAVYVHHGKEEVLVRHPLVL